MAQERRSWIKYNPLSSDFSSWSHGKGDPMPGEMDSMEKNWRGDRETEDPSS